MEFYYDGQAAEKYEWEEIWALPQRSCPMCGERHDIDYPKCPHCKHLNIEGKPVRLEDGKEEKEKCREIL